MLWINPGQVAALGAALVAAEEPAAGVLALERDMSAWGSVARTFCFVSLFHNDNMSVWIMDPLGHQVAGRKNPKKGLEIEDRTRNPDDQ